MPVRNFARRALDSLAYRTASHLVPRLAAGQESLAQRLTELGAEPLAQRLTELGADPLAQRLSERLAADHLGGAVDAFVDRVATRVDAEH
jgi:hypothetical protein